MTLTVEVDMQPAWPFKSLLLGRGEKKGMRSLITVTLELEAGVSRWPFLLFVFSKS